MRHAIALTFGFLLISAFTAPTRAETPAVSEEEAHAIGVDAYLYFYPLILMDLTRLQGTNIEAGEEPLKGPANMFINASAYPPADFRSVVRPNFDTLYSAAWLDLTKEPIVMSVPNTDGRYYLLPMLDMWTDVFDSPGWRTTGTEAQRRSRRPHPMCGSSAASRPTALRTTMQFTRSRPA
jgi:hypothetical protein